jgi:hypothetical protein
MRVGVRKLRTLGDDVWRSVAVVPIYPFPAAIFHLQIIMSTKPPTSTYANFVSIFNAALETYKRKTKNDLASHLFRPKLQSPEAILAVLREQIPAFSQFQIGNESLTTRLTKWIVPTVNVLYSVSDMLGQGGWVGEYQGISSCEKFLLK